MARVTLEVTLVAAHGLEHYYFLQEEAPFEDQSSSAAAVYALIYLVSRNGDVVHAMHRTPPAVDSGAGSDPEWGGFTAGFSVPLEDIHAQDLLFSLVSGGAGGGGCDYGLGDVRVPVSELLVIHALASRYSAEEDHPAAPWTGSEFSYPVETPWGWRRGTLCFRVRCAPAAAAGEWVATGVPVTAGSITPPAAYDRELAHAYLLDEYSNLRRRYRRNNYNDKLFRFLLAMSVAWLLLMLLLHVLLSQIYPVGSSIRAPLPVILMYGYPALQLPAPVPPPAPAAEAPRPRWQVILLLGGLLAAIRCCCCT